MKIRQNNNFDLFKTFRSQRISWSTLKSLEVEKIVAQCFQAKFSSKISVQNFVPICEVAIELASKLELLEQKNMGAVMGNPGQSHR